MPFFQDYFIISWIISFELDLMCCYLILATVWMSSPVYFWGSFVHEPTSQPSRGRGYCSSSVGNSEKHPDKKQSPLLLLWQPAKGDYKRINTKHQKTTRILPTIHMQMVGGRGRSDSDKAAFVCLWYQLCTNIWTVSLKRIVTEHLSFWEIVSLSLTSDIYILLEQIIKTKIRQIKTGLSTCKNHMWFLSEIVWCDASWTDHFITARIKSFCCIVPCSMKSNTSVLHPAPWHLACNTFQRICSVVTSFVWYWCLSQIGFHIVLDRPAVIELRSLRHLLSQT